MAKAGRQGAAIRRTGEATPRRPVAALQKHDHARCVADALDRAAAICAERGTRLTALRRRVLEHVWDSHVPSGAYDLLDKLRSEGRRAAPPTVYRALEFLSEQGLVHRIESRNAYVGCDHAGEPHFAQYLLCERCGTGVELDAAEIDRAIAGQAARLGFAVARQTVEVHGLCRPCRGGEA